MDHTLEQLPDAIRQHITEMLAIATQARQFAQHASRQVGAAVLTQSPTGETHIYKGANWKLIPGKTPHRYCAERVAALAALSEGNFNDIIAVVVVANMRKDRDYDGLVKMCDECVDFFQTGFKHPHTVWVVTVDANTNQTRVMKFSDLIQ
jgi:cytidine deaminase